MKTKILATMLFITIWGLESCTKDTSSGFNAQLPPETQVGANTFGVTINGKVYKPRDPIGSGIYPNSKGMSLWGATDYSWYEIEVKDGASAIGFNMIIHIDHLATVGKLMLSQSNFHSEYDSGLFTHIYFKIWDATISNYAYYGSIVNQGEINVTRLDSGLFSGNFKGKFVRYDNPNDFITINDGRFDINSQTLPNAVFP